MRKLHCLPVSIRLLIRRVTCAFLSRRFPGHISLPAILPLFSAIYRSNDPFSQAMARIYGPANVLLAPGEANGFGWRRLDRGFIGLPA